MVAAKADGDAGLERKTGHGFPLGSIGSVVLVPATIRARRNAGQSAVKPRDTGGNPVNPASAEAALRTPSVTPDCLRDAAGRNCSRPARNWPSLHRRPAGTARHRRGGLVSDTHHRRTGPRTGSPSTPRRTFLQHAAGRLHWPYLDGLTVYSERVSGDDAGHELRTSVVSNGSLSSSHCWRVFDAASHRAEFRQLDLESPLLQLGGDWEIRRRRGSPRSR